MYDREKQIREQRIIEASRKGYTGLEGKFGIILRILGQPIIANYTGDDVNLFQNDPYYQVEEEEMPTFDEEETYSRIGAQYSALSYGIPIEIIYNEWRKELCVTYKGVPVYKEVENEIVGFVPHEEWEQKIDQIHALAKQVEIKKMKADVVEQRQEIDRDKASFIDKMRKLWGF